MAEIEKESGKRIFFPGEWEEQDAVLLTWPDAGTDWAPVLHQAVATYVELSALIARRQTLLIVCRQPEQVRTLLPVSCGHNIRLLSCAYNDTWIRDYGPVTVFRDGQPRLLDFGFDGWGGKFEAEDDNRVTSRLFREGALGKKAGYVDMNHFILEGGSIETDGRGTLLTTTRCLLTNTRNPGADRRPDRDDPSRAPGPGAGPLVAERLSGRR
jgi:agmatine deiminase